MTGVRTKFQTYSATSCRGCAGGRLPRMATKKKTKKKQTRSKRTVGKKIMPTKKLGQNRGILKKKSKRKPAQKKAAVRMKPSGKKTIGAKRARARKKRAPEKSQSVDTVALPPEAREARLGRQSGDLQALSNVEGADSESVDELLEEGNTLEAGVVTGVEAADNADESEVRTHEVPEDDVPGEYLDKE
jgi:hypothetical protein